MSSNSYKYLIKVVGQIHHLLGDELVDALKSVGAMTIISRPFSDLEKCTTVAQVLIEHLSGVLSGVTGKQYVIFMEKNPFFSKGDEPPTIKEDWDPAVLIKLYAAEAESLKGAVLRYNICADILVDRWTPNFWAHAIHEAAEPQ